MQTKPVRRMMRLCLILPGVILISGLACAVPVGNAGPTVTSIAPTVQPLPTNTMIPTFPAPPTATQAPPAPDVSEVQIYLVAVGDGGSSGKAVGCGDSLVPVKRQIQPTHQPIVAALNALFEIKTQTVGESGLYNALYQSNLRVESADVDGNGIATVVLTGQVMMGGECDTPRFKGQIEQTIISSGGVQSANILLNGKTIDQALSLK
jgi:hypothetical protein